MLSTDKIRELLHDRRLDVVSDATGLHRNTLAAIRDAKHLNPSYDTVAKLTEYFSKQAI